MNCIICENNIIINNSKEFNKNIHILVCNKCLKSKENEQLFISKSLCKTKYLLKDQDLSLVKYVYIDKINNNNKYYLFSDIQKIIIKKYGNIHELKSKIDNKQNKMKRRIENKNKSIENKKKKLTDILSKFRLNVNEYGIHYEYINGKNITIDDVLGYEKCKKYNDNYRINHFISELNKYNLCYDESNIDHYNYVNGIGHKGIKDIIDDSFNNFVLNF